MSIKAVEMDKDKDKELTITELEYQPQVVCSLVPLVELLYVRMFDLVGKSHLYMETYMQHTDTALHSTYMYIVKFLS